MHTAPCGARSRASGRSCVWCSSLRCMPSSVAHGSRIASRPAVWARAPRKRRAHAPAPRGPQAAMPLSNGPSPQRPDCADEPIPQGTSPSPAWRTNRARATPAPSWRLSAHGPSPPCANASGPSIGRRCSSRRQRSERARRLTGRGGAQPGAQTLAACSPGVDARQGVRRRCALLPGPLLGRSLRLRCIQREAVRERWAAPHPTLRLTGQRYTLNHLVA